MSVEQTIHGGCQVMPFGQDADGNDIKQFTMMGDQHGHLFFHYRMPENLAREVADELLMTNDELAAKRADEEQSAKARQLLAGGNGGAPEVTPEMLRQMQGQQGGSSPN